MRTCTHVHMHPRAVRPRYASRHCATSYLVHVHACAYTHLRMRRRMYTRTHARMHARMLKHLPCTHAMLAQDAHAGHAHSAHSARMQGMHTVHACIAQTQCMHVARIARIQRPHLSTHAQTHARMQAHMHERMHTHRHASTHIMHRSCHVRTLCHAVHTRYAVQACTHTRHVHHVHAPHTPNAANSHTRTECRRDCIHRSHRFGRDQRCAASAQQLPATRRTEGEDGWRGHE